MEQNKEQGIDNISNGLYRISVVTNKNIHNKKNANN